MGMRTIGLRGWGTALALALLAHIALAMTVTPPHPRQGPLGDGDDGLQVGLAAGPTGATTAEGDGPASADTFPAEPQPVMAEAAPEFEAAEAPREPEAAEAPQDEALPTDPPAEALPTHPQTDTVAEEAPPVAVTDAPDRGPIREWLSVAPPLRKPAAPSRAAASKPPVKAVTPARVNSVAAAPPRKIDTAAPPRTTGAAAPPRTTEAGAPPANQASLSPPMQGDGAAGAARPSAGPRYRLGAPGNPPPRYPETARRRGQEGQVLLAVQVAGDGTVLDVAVDRSSGHPALDDAARAAVRRWRFQPAGGPGRQQTARLHVPITFRLTN